MYLRCIWGLSEVYLGCIWVYLGCIWGVSGVARRLGGGMEGAWRRYGGGMEEDWRRIEGLKGGWKRVRGGMEVCLRCIWGVSGTYLRCIWMYLGGIWVYLGCTYGGLVPSNVELRRGIFWFSSIFVKNVKKCNFFPPSAQIAWKSRKTMFYVFCIFTPLYRRFSLSRAISAMRREILYRLVSKFFISPRMAR